MVLVVLFQLLNASAFSLMIPSLYKFITTPTTRPEELAVSASPLPGFCFSSTIVAKRVSYATKGLKKHTNIIQTKCRK
jgi:hypothetical protein